MTQLATNGRGVPAVMEPDQVDRGYGTQPVAVYSIHDVQTMARYVGQSGAFNMNEAQAFALMMLCQADGMHPMHAVRRYHILKFGTPSMRAETMLAEMQARGWDVRWITENDDRERQEAHFSHPRKDPDGKSVRYTVKDAETAELLTGPNQGNWKKHRPNMLRARVISNACRMLEPGIIAGVHTPDEAAEIDAQHEGRSGRPSPQRSELRAALDDARRPSPQPEPPDEAPAKAEFRPWLEARLADVHARWCEMAKEHEIDPGKPIPPEQVTNHLISAWIAEGLVDEPLVLDGKGKRDRAKCKAAIQQRWEKDPEGLMAEIDEYLKHKLVELAKAAGLAAEEPGAPEAAGFALAH